MPAGDTTPAPTTGSDLSRSIDPNDSTASKKSSEVGGEYDCSPTSIAEECAMGGAQRHSPRPSDSAYNGGQR